MSKTTYRFKKRENRITFLSLLKVGAVIMLVDLLALYFIFEVNPLERVYMYEVIFHSTVSIVIAYIIIRFLLFLGINYKVARAIGISIPFIVSIVIMIAFPDYLVTFIKLFEATNRTLEALTVIVKDLYLKIKMDLNSISF